METAVLVEVELIPNDGKSAFTDKIGTTFTALMQNRKKTRMTMSDLISRAVLYERAASLEAQALAYVGKLIERDGEEPSVEWKIWSAILNERTAFKHDVYDAPSAQPERKKGKWIDGLPYINSHWWVCSVCHVSAPENHTGYNFCPSCGADMRGE